MPAAGPPVGPLDQGGELLWGRQVSQRSIDIARPETAAGAHRRPKARAFTKKDLLPIMALVGAIYGWLLLVLAVVVAALVLLLR